MVEPSKKRRGAWCSSGRAETRPEELLPGPDLAEIQRQLHFPSLREIINGLGGRRKDVEKLKKTAQNVSGLKEIWDIRENHVSDTFS